MGVWLVWGSLSSENVAVDQWGAYLSAHYRIGKRKQKHTSIFSDQFCQNYIPLARRYGRE